LHGSSFSAPHVLRDFCYFNSILRALTSFELDGVKGVLGHEGFQTTVPCARRDTGAKSRALDAIAAQIEHNGSDSEPHNIDIRMKNRS
jgi:hypothetical protein